MIVTVTLNAAIDKRYVVDEVCARQVNRVRHCVYSPGGKGLNVSKCIAVAGADLLATGLVGGHAGRYIEEGLKSLNIRTDFYHLEAESRSCINIWDEKKREQTEFLEPGFEVSGTEFEGFVGQFQTLIPHADIIAMSGSVPKGLGEDTYYDLVTLCRSAGKKVILDTSGPLLKNAIEAAPTVVKPNLDEIRMLTGKPCHGMDEIVAAARQIQAKGVELVVVSLGSEGSVAAYGADVFRIVVPKIDAVNTVGCGDSMVAGLALGFNAGLPVTETLQRASAMSAASALREETGFYLPEDMERLLPMVQVQKL